MRCKDDPSKEEAPGDWCEGSVVSCVYSVVDIATVPHLSGADNALVEHADGNEPSECQLALCMQLIF